MNYVGNILYANCISLGWFCGVATSMSRYGLRHRSGPFDWYYSDFESVLKLIETDFYEFMEKKNLFVDANEPWIFHDKKFGFLCNHDIQHDFETEYEEIHKKYMHRAECFMQDIKQPTCFIRAVRTEKEISFIEENSKYIYEIIKKYNADNEVVFLILNTMKELPEDFLWFRLDMKQYSAKVYEMRTMFDTSIKFSEYCKHNILPENLIKKNKEFDRSHLRERDKIALLMRRLDDYDLVPILKKIFFDIERGIYLFGAGTYGIQFSSYLVRRGINVKGIIDNNGGGGERCNEIPIFSFSQICDNQNILITVGDDKKVREIEEQILAQYPDSKILKLVELVEVFGENIFGID